jgi:hypothetical protein
MGRKKRRRAGEHASQPSLESGGWGRKVALLVVVAAAVALAIGTWQRESPSDETPAPDSEAPRSAAGPPPPAPTPPPALARTPPAEVSTGAPARYRPLLGDWVRPDGGYVLSVTGIAEEGDATVAYFNPRPIHVARAEVRQESDLVGIFVELRDRGYPGSTYTLAYDAQADQLKGLYFQATQRATYDVVFVRR